MVRVAMPPSSRLARRCLVFLLPAGSLLARPTDAGKQPFADIVDSTARRYGVDPDLVYAGDVPWAGGAVRARRG